MAHSRRAISVQMPPGPVTRVQVKTFKKNLKLILEDLDQPFSSSKIERAEILKVQKLISRYNGTIFERREANLLINLG